MILLSFSLCLDLFFPGARAIGTPAVPGGPGVPIVLSGRWPRSSGTIRSTSSYYPLRLRG